MQGVEIFCVETTAGEVRAASRSKSPAASRQRSAAASTVCASTRSRTPTRSGSSERARRFRADNVAERFGSVLVPKRLVECFSLPHSWHEDSELNFEVSDHSSRHRYVGLQFSVVCSCTLDLTQQQRRKKTRMQKLTCLCLQQRCAKTAHNHAHLGFCGRCSHFAFDEATPQRSEVWLCPSTLL